MSVKFDLKQFKKNARARFLITMPILKFSSPHLFKKKKIIKQYLCNNIELSMKPKWSKGRELTLQEDPCICRNNFRSLESNFRTEIQKCKSWKASWKTNHLLIHRQFLSIFKRHWAICQHGTEVGERGGGENGDCRDWYNKMATGLHGTQNEITTVLTDDQMKSIYCSQAWPPQVED